MIAKFSLTSPNHFFFGMLFYRMLFSCALVLPSFRGTPANPLGLNKSNSLSSIDNDVIFGTHVESC